MADTLQPRQEGHRIGKIGRRMIPVEQKLARAGGRRCAGEGLVGAAIETDLDTAGGRGKAAGHFGVGIQLDHGAVGAAGDAERHRPALVGRRLGKAVAAL